MSGRIILGGRPLMSGTYGGTPKCICGAAVEIAGRCQPCHDAIRRRRVGLPPRGDAEARRLAGYLKEFGARQGRCGECERLDPGPQQMSGRGDEPHDPRCPYAD